RRIALRVAGPRPIGVRPARHSATRSRRAFLPATDNRPALRSPVDACYTAGRPRRLSDGLEPTACTVATLLFGFVGSFTLQAAQILGCHIAGDVFARKT